MDGLSRAAGAPIDIELGGKTYLFSPLNFDDIGTIENKLIKDRPNPLAVVGEARQYLDDETYKQLIQQAYHDAKSVARITEEEFNDFLTSREGLIFGLWLCLLHHKPDLEYEFVLDQVKLMTEDQFSSLQSTIQIGMGTSELGNSTGGQSAEAMAATANTPTGEKFTDSLPKSTDGDQT